MEENSDSVASFSSVVDNIYSSCDEEKNETVYASALIDFMRPHIGNHPTGINTLHSVLDPNNENPLVSRQAFYNAMRKWTTCINEGDTKSSEFSSSDEKEITSSPQSSPKLSLASSLGKKSITETSSTNVSQDIQYLELEEKCRELEYKNAQYIDELKIVKSQLAVTEELNLDLQVNLDRAKKKLLHEQEINDCRQKNSEENVDLQEDKIRLNEKIRQLQNMLTLAKKENEDLVTSLQDIESQGEQNLRKISELHKRDEQKMREIAKLKLRVEEYEIEKGIFQSLTRELEENVKEQTKRAEHYNEVSQIYQDEIKELRLNIEKLGRKEANYSLHNISDLGESSVENCVSIIDRVCDISIDSELENTSFKRENLFSELQACGFTNDSEQRIKDQYLKEHENCSKIIQNYQEQIEDFSKKLEEAEIENSNILARCKNTENEILKITSEKNEELLNEISNLTHQLTLLNKEIDERDAELSEMQDLKSKYDELFTEIRKLKAEKERDNEKYESLSQEKNNFQKLFEEIENEKNELVSKNNSYLTKVSELESLLNSKENELKEIQNERNDLSNEIINLKYEQDKNSREIEQVSKDLKHCTDNGKRNLQTIKIKFINLKTKAEFLEKLMENQIQTVEELQIENKIILIKIDSLSNDKNSNDETSTSTDGNEKSSERPELKRRLHKRKKSENELLFKINRLENNVSFLERKLSQENLKVSQMSNFETQITKLENEKKNLEMEKNDMFDAMEKMKNDFSFAIKQLEDRQRLELDNSKELYNFENQVLVEELSKMKDKEVGLMKQIETFRKDSINYLDERFRLVDRVEKQKVKIIALKKAVSDVDNLYKATRSVKNLIVEKDSLLNLNRNSLENSKSCLQMAESRVNNLESLISKSKLVFTDTATIVFNSTRMTFEVWKRYFKNNFNHKMIETLESLQNIYETSHDLTEEYIQMVNNRLILTSYLLDELAKHAGYACDETQSFKNISKFTLKPFKQQVFKHSSTDPDTSSSKDEFSTEKFDENHGEIIDADYETFLGDLKNSSSELTTARVSDQRSKRVQMLNNCSDRSLSSCNVSTETENSFDSQEETTRLNDIKAHTGKFRWLGKNFWCIFFFVLVAFLCFGMAVILLQLGCIRSNKGSICPLDSFIVVTKDPYLSPH